MQAGVRLGCAATFSLLRNTSTAFSLIIGIAPCFDLLPARPLSISFLHYLYLIAG
jgi:hypothetical protein